jgi:hypothetical protein
VTDIFLYGLFAFGAAVSCLANLSMAVATQTHVIRITSRPVRHLNLWWRVAPWLNMIFLPYLSLMLAEWGRYQVQTFPSLAESLLSWSSLIIATAIGSLIALYLRLSTRTWPACFGISVSGHTRNLKIELRQDQWIVHFNPPHAAKRCHGESLVGFIRELDNLLATAQADGWAPAEVILDSHLLPRNNIVTLSRRLLGSFSSTKLHSCRVEPVRRLKGPYWLVQRSYARRFGSGCRIPDGFSRKASLRLF